MVDARWLEVSLTVEPELAEALAEVLGRFVSNGVVVESGVEYNDAEDEGTPVGPVRVYGYLIVDDTLEERRQRLEEAIWHLGQIQDIPEPGFRAIDDEDWMASWKKHYRPIPIGKSILILPAWMEAEEAYQNRLVVKIDPSMAFGTGTHPTTQLCLELLEQYVRPGEPVIDVGCGSGILSIGAVKLGASKVIAVDIDNAAIRATKENGEANGVLASIETGVGSVTEVRQGSWSVSQAGLVVANILAPVIIRLFEAGLGDLVTPGGVLLLSGILDTQAQGVLDAAAPHGFQLIDKRQIADWVALAVQRQ